MSTGDIHNIGTLFIDDDIIINPTNGYKDEHKFSSYNYNSKIKILDTSEFADYTIKWVEIDYLNSKFFICSRNLIIDISYNDLKRMGFIEGIDVTIDGTKYKLRVLSGISSNNDSKSNEWDLYICNVLGSSGLPAISDSESIDHHNNFWNWRGIYSICSSDCDDEKIFAARGHKSYNSLYAYSSHIPNEFIGWRPVLECVSENPNELNENSTITNVYNKIILINNDIDLQIDKLKNILNTKGIDCSTLSTLSDLIDNVDRLQL